MVVRQITCGHIDMDIQVLVHSEAGRGPWRYARSLLADDKSVSSALIASFEVVDPREERGEKRLCMLRSTLSGAFMVVRNHREGMFTAKVDKSTSKIKVENCFVRRTKTMLGKRDFAFE